MRGTRFMLVLNFVEKKYVLREHLMSHWDTNKRSVNDSYGKEVHARCKKRA